MSDIFREFVPFYGEGEGGRDAVMYGDGGWRGTNIMTSEIEKKKLVVTSWRLTKGSVFKLSKCEEYL